MVWKWGCHMWGLCCHTAGLRPEPAPVFTIVGGPTLTPILTASLSGYLRGGNQPWDPHFTPSHSLAAPSGDSNLRLVRFQGGVPCGSEQKGN